jgi:membrane protein YdbS with pleckstrin-like domain
MVHATPTSTAPLFVNKLLLANEHQVVCVRFHPAKVLGPLSLVFAGLIVAGLLSSVTHGTELDAVWVAWGLLLLWLIWKILNWLVDYFVVTSKRVILATGLLVRKVEMMPLVKVTDMSYQQSVRGRVLKYGQFIFESAGQEQHLREVDYIPHPEQLYLEVCGLIFADEDKVDSGFLRKVNSRWRDSPPVACAVTA